MLSLSLFALAVAGQALGPLGSASRSADVLAVLEALVRTVAAEDCVNTVCYVSVDGQAPVRSLRERLLDVPHVRPMPTSGLPPSERDGAKVIDLSSVKFRSDSRAEASATVLWDMAGTFLATDSCRYHFARGTQGWDLRPKETTCLVM